MTTSHHQRVSVEEQMPSISVLRKRVRVRSSSCAFTGSDERACGAETSQSRSQTHSKPTIAHVKL